MRILKINQ